MPKPTPFTTALDRRLAAVLSARAHRQSTVLRLVPEWCLAALLAPSAKRLRTKLLTVLLALLILIVAAAFWLALH